MEVKKTYNSIHLSYEEQLEKFLERGMKFKDRELCLSKLKSVNYYKLKEFAIPFYKNIGGVMKYDDIFLEKIIRRFYQDKNIRISFLYAIEKVELSFKNKLAYILGEKLSAFGYLEFKNWVDKDEYCKHFVKYKESQFKKNIKQKLNRTFNPFIKEFYDNYNLEFPPIWLLIEILTFGDALEIYDLMTKKDKIKVANNYNCKTNELKSWLEHLKLIRNMCAHNSGIIDIKLRTIPIIREEWKVNLYCHNGKYTNRIANTLVILKYLLTQINPSFHFGDISKGFHKLIYNKNEHAYLYGLSSANLNFLFNND